MIELLEHKAEKLGDTQIYSFLNRSNEVSNSFTYTQLYEESLAVAIGLQELGLSKQPVGLILSHGYDFIIAFWGCILAGCYPTPFGKPRGQNYSHLTKKIIDSDISVAIVSNEADKLWPSTGFILKDLKIQSINTFKQYRGLHYQRPNVSSNEIAFIQYTSGSFSKPKGICISHNNIISNSNVIKKNFRLEENDIVLSWLPFIHDMGLIGHVVQALYSGVHNYFIGPFNFISNPISWINSISRYNVTVSGGPTFGYELCEQKVDINSLATDLDISSWRLAYCGSEPVRPAVMERFSKKFSKIGFRNTSFYPCYGLAESTLFVCGRLGINLDYSSENNVKNVSVGKLSEDANIQIIDELTLKTQKEGSIGEVCVSSPSVMLRYYKEQDDESSTFINLNGYRMLRTGDLGYLKNKNLFIVGRIKNCFKIRGVTLYIEDIEEIVNEVAIAHGFHKSAVFPHVHNNTVTTNVLLEYPKAMLRNPNKEKMDELTNEILESLLKNMGLANVKIVYLRTNSIPLTTSGKVKRNELAGLTS